VLVMAAVFALVFSGAAAATVLGSHPTTTSEPGDHPEGTEVLEDTDLGVLGEPIERFHEAGACDLTDVSVLAGNWTGGYVSVVAQAGDATLVPGAARSDCGTPMVAVGHGGPPAHALEHIPGGSPGAPSEAVGRPGS